MEHLRASGEIIVGSYIPALTTCRRRNASTIVEMSASSLNHQQIFDRRLDPDAFKARKLARCGFLGSCCFASGAIALPIGLVLLHTLVSTNYLERFRLLGLLLSIGLVVGAILLLASGLVCIQRRTRELNRIRESALEIDELPIFLSDAVDP